MVPAFRLHRRNFSSKNFSRLLALMFFCCCFFSYFISWKLGRGKGGSSEEILDVLLIFSARPFLNIIGSMLDVLLCLSRVFFLSLL